jgi:hypothetical protein
MGVSLPEFDGEGNLIDVHKVDFANGQTSPQFIGGSLAVKDPVIIDLLEKSPRNQKNGGADWYLEKVMEEETEASNEAEVSEPAFEASPESSEEGFEQENVGVTDYPEITTNPQAVAKLRELDPSIKTAEVRNQAQIRAAAEKLNISFSNL